MSSRRNQRYLETCLTVEQFAGGRVAVKSEGALAPIHACFDRPEVLKDSPKLVSHFSPRQPPAQPPLVTVPDGSVFRRQERHPVWLVVGARAVEQTCLSPSHSSSWCSVGLLFLPSKTPPRVKHLTGAIELMTVSLRHRLAKNLSLILS